MHTVAFPGAQGTVGIEADPLIPGLGPGLAFSVFAITEGKPGKIHRSGAVCSVSNAWQRFPSCS